MYIYIYKKKRNTLPLLWTTRIFLMSWQVPWKQLAHYFGGSFSSLSPLHSECGTTWSCDESHGWDESLLLLLSGLPFSLVLVVVPKKSTELVACFFRRRVFKSKVDSELSGRWRSSGRRRPLSASMVRTKAASMLFKNLKCFSSVHDSVCSLATCDSMYVCPPVNNRRRRVKSPSLFVFCFFSPGFVLSVELKIRGWYCFGKTAPSPCGERRLSFIRIYIEKRMRVWKERHSPDQGTTCASLIMN